MNFCLGVFEIGGRWEEDTGFFDYFVFFMFLGGFVGVYLGFGIVVGRFEFGVWGFGVG